jgi:hypothetical protein
MVQFLPLNIKDEDSLDLILAQIDTCLQYDEDVEPKEPKDFADIGDTEHKELASMQEYIEASNL